MTTPGWEVEVSDEAAADIRGIVRWTRGRFGSVQAVEYGRAIKAALSDLTAEPDALGTKDCSEAGHGYRTLHVARHGRRGRHFILFRFRSEEHRVIVVRVLHEAMDLARQILGGDADGEWDDEF